MSDRSARRYAVIGTGGRSRMYVDALTSSHADLGEIVAFLDPNEARMAYYDRYLADRGHQAPPHFSPEQFEEMLTSTAPDVLIVTSKDSTHADHIVAGLDRGLDVITEKPMTIDVPSLERVVRAAQESTGTLTVTFNYRYSPRNSTVRRLIAEGAIGTVTSVHFEWCLDTVHGADYFRRWHREKDSSGGLAVHKSTHHFDLVNWWLADVPETVFALGGLRFYGAENAAARGLGERPALGRDLLAAGDPFALDLAADPQLKGLFLDAEHLDGYHRDQDVFGSGITIEDNLSVTVGYHRGAAMSYSLNAHSPWEGYRVAFNGTEGRLELDVVERGAVSAERTTSGLGAGGKDRPVLDPSATEAERTGQQLRPHGSRLMLQRLWSQPEEVPVPEGTGAHGGGDAMLLDDIFRGASEDPLGRQAGYRDGVRSVIVGAAVNDSLATGQAVHIADYGELTRAAVLGE